MINDSLDQQRRDYGDNGLDRDQLHDDPHGQFQLWFDEAHDKAPGDWFEPHAMTVATCDSNGNVSARTVLLKEFDNDGFVFYTNYSSHKGRDLDANPCASLLFYWPYLARQIRIEGSVQKVDRKRSEALLSLTTSGKPTECRCLGTIEGCAG